MARCVDKQPIRSFGLGGRGGVLLGATATNEIPTKQPWVISLTGALADAQCPLLFVASVLAHVKMVRRPPAFSLWSRVPDLSHVTPASSFWWSLRSGVIIRLIILVESPIWSYYQTHNHFKIHLFSSELSPNSPFEQPLCTVCSSWEISSLLYSFLLTDMINPKDIVPRGCIFFFLKESMAISQQFFFVWRLGAFECVNCEKHIRILF